MITISLCMIVKNEETVLARCLDSVASLMDEIIIVDTGSTDHTKDIARHYTDKIFDYTWCDDFAAARNFSFSKAAMEYIYAPDADEYLDPDNQALFAQLKEVLLPEIEIVQMHYLTPSLHNTVQNCHNELRPKLFKRLRTFTWIDPIHETVRLNPVVFDSDICIHHLPQSAHQNRDFAIFERAIIRDGRLSDRILTMYAKELLKCGTPKDFANAAPYFEALYEQEITPESTCVLAHHYRILGKTDRFFAVALKNIATTSCSEICCELGAYYLEKHIYDEACLWYYNAAFETQPALVVEAGGRIALAALADSYAECAKISAEESDPETAEHFRQLSQDYRKQASEWVMPEAL